jgi:DNA-3-methyladenine glycosylase I
MTEQSSDIIRCNWVTKGDTLYEHYHDKEWGTPTHNDNALFEHLMLEVAQAGLSWSTILKKRENYRAAFAQFDPAKVAKFTSRDVERLLQDAGIIRNRLKINAAIVDAQQFLKIQEEFGSFDNYQKQFTPKHKTRRKGSDIPAITAESEAFSKDLRKRGFKFLGPTTLYAHMQATGMVNDHITTCFRYNELVDQEAS